MLVNLVQRTSQLFLPRLELGTNSLATVGIIRRRAELTQSKWLPFGAAGMDIILPHVDEIIPM
jgi:hypothetical protein